MQNERLIEKTVEITVATLSNSDISINSIGGEHVADFMQQIYNKLVDLNKNED